MKKTVIGAFENNSEALQAKQELLSAGFSEQSITLHGRTEPDANDDLPNDNPGFMQAIRSLFTWDLDDYRDENYGDHYLEAVRRGHAVLTVDVDEDEVEQACELMDSAGALDIDQKISEWRSQGYTSGQSPGGDLDDMNSGLSGAATGATAKNQADSGLGQTTGGSTPVVGQGNLDRSTSTGLNANLNQDLGVGREDQDINTPTSRHNVRVLPQSNRNASRP